MKKRPKDQHLVCPGCGIGLWYYSKGTEEALQEITRDGTRLASIHTKEACFRRVRAHVVKRLRERGYIIHDEHVQEIEAL